VFEVQAERDIGMNDNSDNFTPRWSECNGVFNEGNGLSGRENEEAHYRKHAVIGKEWEEDLSLNDYRSRAKDHLNDLASDDVFEFCQAEDLAVVKYNLAEGNLGIARRDDGTIKTFFRPNDLHYVLRKVESGVWGSPDIVDGFEIGAQSADFADDPEKSYLFERLQALALELPFQAHQVIEGFAEGNPPVEDLMSLLARIAECRFTAFELRRRVLTEEQESTVFSLRKKIIIANASFEALERYRGQELVQLVDSGLKSRVDAQIDLWIEADRLVYDLEDFESSLEERRSVGFMLMELRILHLNGRMRELNIATFEYRLRKSDLYLRKFFYSLALEFNYKESHLVSPDDFFWSHMAGIQYI
jgi:hypothetical protein